MWYVILTEAASGKALQIFNNQAVYRESHALHALIKADVVQIE